MDLPEPITAAEATHVAVRRIQPRMFERMDLGDLAGLAFDIQAMGLAWPLVLNERYELISGERRLAAMQANSRGNLRTVPAVVTDDLDVIEAQLRAEHRYPWVKHNKQYNPCEAMMFMWMLQDIYAPGVSGAAGYADNYRKEAPRRLKALAMAMTGYGRANTAKLASALRVARNANDPVEAARIRKVLNDPRWATKDSNVERFVVAMGGRAPRQDRSAFEKALDVVGGDRGKMPNPTTARTILTELGSTLNGLSVATSKIQVLHPGIEPDETQGWLAGINAGMKELRRIRRMLQNRVESKQ